MVSPLAGQADGNLPLRLAHILFAVAILASGFGAWKYQQHQAERAEIEKHWVKLKGFQGAVKRGSVKSMEPVNLSVWRYRSDEIPETTYEHLEFEIPAAYLHWKDDLSGGKQKEIIMSVHWPTGEPDGFHDNLEVFDRYSLGWPIEKYFMEIRSWGVPNLNVSDDERVRLYNSLLYTSGKRPNTYKGEMCGWHAFEQLNRGRNTFEIKNPKVNLTPELFFDSLEPTKWERRIKCGPDLRVCTLYTDFQRFTLAISFSPLNICKADQLEKQARSLLDEFLTKHHPPTRMWNSDTSDKVHPFENSVEWTRENLNNQDIREAAK